MCVAGDNAVAGGLGVYDEALTDSEGTELSPFCSKIGAERSPFYGEVITVSDGAELSLFSDEFGAAPSPLSGEIGAVGARGAARPARRRTF